MADSGKNYSTANVNRHRAHLRKAFGKDVDALGLATYARMERYTVLMNIKYPKPEECRILTDEEVEALVKAGKWKGTYSPELEYRVPGEHEKWEDTENPAD